jgi:hypothetical protein
MKPLLSKLHASLVAFLVVWTAIAPALATTYEQVNTTSVQSLEHKTYIDPIFSGTSSGTYTLGGTVTITSPTITGPTITGTVGGSATYSTPTISGGTLNSSTINTPTLNLQTYAESSLPSAGTAGRVVWLSDGPKGLVGDFGSKLAHLFGYNWVAEAYSDCNAAITAIGGTQATLVIGKTCTISSTTTIPTTLTILLTGAGGFSVDSGQTLTLAGVIQAPPTRQIFSGSGSVVCTSACKMTEVWLEWWGGGPGIAAATNTSAGTKAIAFLPAGVNKGGTLRFQGGTYQHDNTFASNGRYLTFRGQGQYVTKLQLTATGSSKHAINATGTTGYLGVFDMEISPSSPVSSDLTMKMVNADGLLETLASNTVIEVARVRSTGFNFGLSCDGTSSITIERCSIVDSNISTRGASSSSISDPVLSQQARWFVAERNILNNNDLGDHCVYSIHNINLRVVGNECEGSADYGLKIISQSDSNGVTATLGSWTIEGNTVHDAGAGLQISLYQSHVGTDISARHNRFSNLTDVGSAHAAVFAEATETSTIRRLDFSDTVVDTVESGAIGVNAETGSTIELFVAKDLHIRNWSTGSSGTYQGLNYAGGGTFKHAILSGHFDGNSTGKWASALQVSGGFEHIQHLDMVVLNTTDHLAYPLVSPIGQSETYGRVPVKLYTKTGSTTGTTAVTSEETLATYTLPAKALSEDGQCVRILAYGYFEANANTKTLRLYFGSTAIISNATTTAPNNVNWVAKASVCRIGSSQQLGYAEMTAGTAPQATQTLNITETLSSSVVIKATGQNGTANANDIELWGFEVDLHNQS